jgi:hypothetical protein
MGLSHRLVLPSQSEEFSMSLHQFLAAILDRIRQIARIVMPILAELGFCLKSRLAAMGAISLAVLCGALSKFVAPTL